MTSGQLDFGVSCPLASGITNAVWENNYIGLVASRKLRYSCVWSPVIPELRKLRQEDYLKLDSSLDYGVSSRTTVS